MKIRTKINVSFLIIFLLIGALIAAFMGTYATNLVKNNIYSYLQSSSRARAEHVRTFIQDQKKVAVILSAASVYLDFLKEPINSAQYPIIKEKIIKGFARTMVADPNIIELDIIGLDGKILVSSDPEEEGGDESTDEYFIEGKEGTFIKDVYFLDNKELTYAVSTPIKDSDGSLLGVSLLRYKPDYFYSIVKNENGLGDTEEHFLVNSDKLLITPSRFLNKDFILKEKIDTKNVSDCYDPQEVEYVNKNGYSGLKEKFGNQLVENLDYRNIDVIGTHAYIPEAGWCLITKVDRADALSFRVILTVANSLILLGAIFIFFIIGSLISKIITKPIIDLELATNKIRQGDFGYRVNIDSKDEMGTLAGAFNAMTMEVEQFKNTIEEKVEEQTSSINDKNKALDAQKKAILNILEDIEKEKNNAESFANDLEKFKLAVDNVSDHIVITDPDGIVIYGNKAIQKITGYKPEEALGKKAGVLWRVPMSLEYYQKLWDTIKSKKKTFIGEIQNRRKNGELYNALVSISPVLNADSKILFFVGIERDITKEKQIDQAKTEFVSLASHQLRTPLSTINWYAEMLINGDAGKLKPEQADYLQEIYRGNQRMVELVNSLLNVSRLELGTFVVEPKITDVTKIADQAIADLDHKISEKKQVFKKIYDKNLKEMMLDEKLMGIIFQNLLSNAVKYTPEKGKIKLEIKIKDKMFEIMVADTGIGIPVAQQDRIFTKLFRADNVRAADTEGTGLGLYLIKSIVEHSGGKVWFESVENKGTTFYVDLPLVGMKKKEGDKELS